MQARDAAILISRTLGLLMLIWFVSSLPGLFSILSTGRAMTDDDMRRRAISSLVWSAAVLVVGLCLWRFAPAIGTRMSAGTSAQQPRGWSPDEAWQLVVAGIGLYVLANSVPALILVLGHEAFRSSAFDAMPSSVRSSGFAADLLSALIGLWLFIGSRGIARFAARARSVGLEKSA